MQFRKLLEYKDIINHAYSLGLNVGFKTTTVDQKQASLEVLKLAEYSYKKICNAIESNHVHLVQANQNHTDVIKIVEKKINNNKPDFSFTEEEIEDGLITNNKNLMLATTNADCILLLFFDPIKKVIANIHSGWRGTLQRISVKTIQKMVKEFECEPKDIICCICPSIRRCHFEVDRDVKEMFQNNFLDLDGKQYVNTEKNNKNEKIKITDFIEEKNKDLKWNIDTVLINKIILQDAGLKPENIIDSGICSVCNCDIIHSYRIEKKNYKTETAIIELK